MVKCRLLSKKSLHPTVQYMYEDKNPVNKFQRVSCHVKFRKIHSNSIQKNCWKKNEQQRLRSEFKSTTKADPAKKYVYPTGFQSAKLFAPVRVIIFFLPWVNIGTEKKRYELTDLPPWCRRSAVLSSSSFPVSSSLSPPASTASSLAGPPAGHPRGPPHRLQQCQRTLTTYNIITCTT